MYRRGFTVVELVIVITIMGILLVLGVVNLRGAQANARDEERKTDIESISLHLENFYLSGTDGSTAVGDYPPTTLTGAAIQTSLRDADMKSFTAPGAASLAASFIPATNTVQTTAGVLPQPTISQYVYQPLQADGTLCTTTAQECRKFNLFFRLETDNLVYMVTSKNQ